MLKAKLRKTFPKLSETYRLKISASKMRQSFKKKNWSI